MSASSSDEVTVDLRRRGVDEQRTIERWRWRRRTVRTAPLVTVAPLVVAGAPPRLPVLARRSRRARLRPPCRPHLGSPRYAMFHAPATLDRAPAPPDAVTRRPTATWMVTPRRSCRRRRLPGRVALLAIAMALAGATYAGAAAWVARPGYVHAGR